ncbi:MAG: histidine phosphatase family protein [Mariprofundus sp.]
MLTVDLLRHGELESGIKYRGQLDDPLTGAGRAAMDAVWEQLRPSIDRVITSPLSRCSEPALSWANGAGIECQLDARIAEMYYGQWEGLAAEEIMKRHPGMLEQWRSNPESVQVPGGESVTQLHDRIAAFWSDIGEKHEGQHVLLVAHSGSLRMLIAHVLNAPIVSTRHMQMPYACWSRVVHDNGGNQLVFHNREL